MHLAAAGYRVAISRELVGDGANPNVADGYIFGPVWDAQRQLGTRCGLLDAGAELNARDKNGATALHRAVRMRCAAAVEFLLQADADPTRKNKSGSTPLHLGVQDNGRGGSGADVARTAQRKIIETFLSRGISQSLKDGNGNSVLDCATSEWVRTQHARK